MQEPTLIVAGVVRVPPENLAALRPHLKAYIAACRAEPGCIAFTFAQDLIEPNILRVFEVWRDANSLSKHFQTPHVAQWREAAAALGITGRDLTAYHVAHSQVT